MGRGAEWPDETWKAPASGAIANAAHHATKTKIAATKRLRFVMASMSSDLTRKRSATAGEWNALPRHDIDDSPRGPGAAHQIKARVTAGYEVGVMENLAVRRPAVGCIAWLGFGRRSIAGALLIFSLFPLPLRQTYKIPPRTTIHAKTTANVGSTPCRAGRAGTRKAKRRNMGRPHKSTPYRRRYRTGPKRRRWAHRASRACRIVCRMADNVIEA